MAEDNTVGRRAAASRKGWRSRKRMAAARAEECRMEAPAMVPELEEYPAMDIVTEMKSRPPENVLATPQARPAETGTEVLEPAPETSAVAELIGRVKPGDRIRAGETLLNALMAILDDQASTEIAAEEILASLQARPIKRFERRAMPSGSLEFRNLMAACLGKALEALRASRNQRRIMAEIREELMIKHPPMERRSAA